ncbi:MULTISPECIES: DUF6069 family protein [unclassified Micromonospora]|uniref:DUF6069 family protein n=1 Tax=unclassified Micromonospora TaxID=2617518 RepID=UPI0033205A55
MGPDQPNPPTPRARRHRLHCHARSDGGHHPCAALAQAAGVDFEVPDGDETIPLSGFAVVTGLFSVVGIVIAVALLRWSARPAERFVWTAVSLTAISLVPPLLSGANTATTTALLGLHLVPATVMIPTLARSLRIRTD